MIDNVSVTHLGGLPPGGLTMELILLFTSLLAIPLACQRCLDTTLFAGLQVVGMTLHFLDDVFLLDLALKPAQCIF